MLRRGKDEREGLLDRLIDGDGLLDFRHVDTYTSLLSVYRGGIS
jgi:hypothetical protein